jgi:hypothetical protein
MLQLEEVRDKGGSETANSSVLRKWESWPSLRQKLARAQGIYIRSCSGRVTRATYRTNQITNTINKNVLGETFGEESVNDISFRFVTVSERRLR